MTYNIFNNVIQKCAFLSINLELRKKKIIGKNGK